MNDTKPIRILLLEDTSFDARLVKEALAPMGGRYKLSHVERLREAIALLDRESFDIVITDLSLPDSESLETFSRLREKAPRLPIIILSGLNDEKNAENMVREGAQDYFVKGHLTGDGIARAMRHAIERKRLQLALEEANLDLEERVMERTAELAKINASLSREIVEHRRTGQSLQQVNHRLRALSARMLHIQEDERRQVARDLHDEIGQTLTAANVSVALLRKHAEQDEAFAKKVEGASKLLEQCMHMVHRFARELRPSMLDHLGPYAALQNYIKTFTERTGIKTELESTVSADALDVQQGTVLYRVAQESLTNVYKHAQATRVRIVLRQLPCAVCMEIADNGRASPPPEKLNGAVRGRLGLLGMQERVRLVNGEFAIESVPRRGTTVRVQIPLSPERATEPAAVASN